MDSFSSITTHFLIILVSNFNLPRLELTQFRLGFLRVAQLGGGGGGRKVPAAYNRLSHKLLGNFSATFEIFGDFLEFWQLLEFSATLGFLRFFEATFFTF